MSLGSQHTSHQSFSFSAVREPPGTQLKLQRKRGGEKSNRVVTQADHPELRRWYAIELRDLWSEEWQKLSQITWDCWHTVKVRKYWTITLSGTKYSQTDSNISKLHSPQNRNLLNIFNCVSSNKIANGDLLPSPSFLRENCSIISRVSSSVPKSAIRSTYNGTKYSLMWWRFVAIFLINPKFIAQPCVFLFIYLFILNLFCNLTLHLHRQSFE